VNGQPELVGGADRCLQPVDRPDAPAGAAMRLLDDDDPCRLEPVRGRDRLTDLLGRDPAGVSRQRPGDQPGVDCRPARLEDQDVRPLLRDQLTPRARQDAQGDLVRHRRGRQEERAFVAEQLGGASLELVDGRILLLLLVADVGGRHRREHLR
jgi:hypothetical protein